MGWLQKIKSALTSKSTGLDYASVMTGRTPIYSSFGQDIYASDVVTQAMGCVINEIKKLAPVHVIQDGMDLIPAGAGDVRQHILNRPNHYMNTSDFLSRVMYYYFAKCNSWVVPTYKVTTNGRKVYTGLYPVTPNSVTFVEDATGELFVQLYFEAEREPWTLPYSDIIHLRRDYGPAEYMGGGPDGLPDDRALLRTLEINHQMLTGISKAMKSSQAINGVVKWGSIIEKQRLEAAMVEWERKLQSSESGIIGMDMASTYTPITKDIKLVDAATLKFIDEKILRGFGVSLSILTGDFTKAQHEAFYQHACEHIVIQLTQEFTRVLFTPTESESYGHKIQFFSKELTFLSTDQKISMINLLAPTGAMYENEKRAAFGMRPLPELVGKRYMSLNWIEASKANEYQVGKEDDPDDGGNGDDPDGNGGTNNE